ncbi:MAG: hypothetical protein QOD86_2616 [Miltoncostaeaceae bacterium]|nr:hypothetical protein [Miltoncostaeaceae bacterium]
MAAAAPARLLPDLVQEAPSGLVVRESPDGPLLGFASAVTNLGDGPLIVDASRPTLDRPTMLAEQVVPRPGRAPLRHAGAGELRYVESPDHSHRHLSPFERYELRRVGGRRAVRSGKQGFCLGDRYPSPLAPRHAPLRPSFVTNCGRSSPAKLRLREGISVGYGDDYAAILEGQSVPLAGLPPGRYVLVHWVNGDRRLLETDYSNNAASVLVRLAWRGGRPRVTKLKVCVGSAVCPLPGRSRVAAGGPPG